MNKTVLLIISLSLASLVLGTEMPHRIKPLSTVLAEVEQQHEFGKSLSAMVQLTLHAVDNTASRVSEIGSLLDSIEDSLISRDQRETQKCEDSESYFVRTLADLKEKIDDATTRLDDATKEESDLRTELSDKSSDLESEQNNLVQLKSDRTKADEDLEEEDEQYESKDNDYNSLIIACEEGIKLLKHMVHGEVHFGRQAANFIQITDIKKKIQRASEKIEESTSKKLGMLQPVIAVLTTLTSQTNLNFENVISCINLIQEILDRLRGDLLVLERRHKQALDDLDKLIETLEEETDQALKLIQIYQDRIDDIQKRLEELSRVITDESKLVAEFSSQRDSTNEEYQKTSSDCLSESAKRTAEIATIKRLQDYFAEQVETSTASLSGM